MANWGDNGSPQASTPNAGGGANWSDDPAPKKSAARVSAPSRSVPQHLPIHRTESENPLSTLLRAGSASGKHLVATGQLGVPDVAGEDQDRDKIRHAIGGDALPTSQIAPMLMISPTQGLLDFGIDTGLDWTNLIPFGKVAKGVGEGANLGSKAIGGLIEHSPQIVKDAAGVAQGASNAIRDAFHWGGSARRDLSPEQYQAAGLEFNKHEARHPEVARRMMVRQAAIFAGLSDRQKIDVAKLMNGEVDAVSDPAVMKAAKEAKGLLDDAFTLESDASGRSRAGVSSTKVANAGFIKPEPTKGEAFELTRQQSTAGKAEHSEDRGGTYYTHGGNIFGQDNPLAWLNRGRLGGQHTVTETAHFQKPLKLDGVGALPYLALEKIKGPGWGGRLMKAQRDADEGDSDELYNLLKEVGFEPPTNKMGHISESEHVANLETKTMADRIASKVAQDAGHDAIIGGADETGSREVFAFHNKPQAPIDDFEQMVPSDLPGAPTKANLKRIIGQNLPTRDLPPELREFQSPAEQGVLGARNFRQTYHPGYQSAQTEADDFTRPHSYNLLNPFAGHALEREDFKIGDVSDDKVADTAAQLQAALTRRLKASAVQASAGQLRSALGVKPGLAPQALAKLFDQTPRATGEARNWKEKGQDYLRLPADAARSTLTAFGLKHGLVNVPTLAGLSEGGHPVADMFRDAGKLMKMSPEERWEFMRSAREGGAIGSEHDRDNQTLGLLDKVPVAARAALGGAYGGYQGQKAESDANPGGSPLQRLAAGGAGALVGGAGGAALPRIGRFSNDLTWALDESAKRAVFNAKVKKGMSAADAAQQTLHDTVDYTKRTPIAKGLQDWGLAPFATFATKIPGAVAGSVARNPHNAIMLDRLTQGLASNGTLDLPGEPGHNDGSPAQLAVSNPLSETAELFGDPMKYARAKASDPARIAASAISQFLSHGARGARYMTYGQPIFPHHGQEGWKSGYALNAAAGDIPLGIGRNALDGLDIDEFSPQSAASQILGPLFGAYLK